MREGELVIRVPHTLVVSVVDLMVAPDGEDSEGEEAAVGAAAAAGGGDVNGATAGVADGAGATPAARAPPPVAPPGDTLPAVRAWIQSDPVLSSQPSMALAVYVLALELAGDRTAYAPYLRALPSAIPLPLFFPPPLLARLAPSPLLPTLLRHRRTLAKHYLYLLTLLTHPAAPVPADAAAALPLSRVTWPAFCWAVAVVFTRQNELPTAGRAAATRRAGGRRSPPPDGDGNGGDDGNGGGDDGDGGGAATAMTLIPGWDMCNHADGPATTAYVLRRPASAAVECSAMAAFAAGEEVTIFYGHRPAADFFLHSAFVPSAPPPAMSAVPLAMPLPAAAEDPALPLKLRLLGGPAAAGGDVHAGGTLTAAAVTAARAVALDRPALVAALRAGGAWERGAAAVAANEVRAVALLRAALHGAVARYGDPNSPAAGADAGGAARPGGAEARLVDEMLALERRMYADAAARLDAVALAEGGGVSPLEVAVRMPPALGGGGGAPVGGGGAAPVDDAASAPAGAAEHASDGAAGAADGAGAPDAAAVAADAAAGADGAAAGAAAQ